MINVLQHINQVSLEKLQLLYQYQFYLRVGVKKSLLFLSLPSLNIETLWFPIIKSWLAQNIPKNQTLYLAIDINSWQRNNLIRISMIYNERYIPIYFEFLRLF